MHRQYNPPTPSVNIVMSEVKTSKPVAGIYAFRSTDDAIDKTFLPPRATRYTPRVLTSLQF